MYNINKYFSLLGINSNSSIDEVKNAYREMMKVWHPDRYPNIARLQDLANRKSQELNEAYQVIIAYIKTDTSQIRRPDIKRSDIVSQEDQRASDNSNKSSQWSEWNTNETKYGGINSRWDDFPELGIINDIYFFSYARPLWKLLSVLIIIILCVLSTIIFTWLISISIGRYEILLQIGMYLSYLISYLSTWRFFRMLTKRNIIKFVFTFEEEQERKWKQL